MTEGAEKRSFIIVQILLTYINKWNNTYYGKPRYASPESQAIILTSPGWDEYARELDNAWIRAR